MRVRAWKFRIYPSKVQEENLDKCLYWCKELWNKILEYTKQYNRETGRYPSVKELYLQTKRTPLFSQVAQNVADRMAKCIGIMVLKRKIGTGAGFPRFKPIERMKSFTYPQFGFGLGKKLELSGMGPIQVRKHREIMGEIKTLTVKKMPSGKWFAILTSEIEEKQVTRQPGIPIGIDLGIENFAYLSDGTFVENPRHLKSSEKRLGEIQHKFSRKNKKSKNRAKARLRVARAYEKLVNKRRDFLHKLSHDLVGRYSVVAMEKLNFSGLAKGLHAKSVRDCSWAEFSGMVRYKAEEAGCELLLVDPARTSQECSCCGRVHKKQLSERWHRCECGASMHRDLNAAVNILKRATLGQRGSNACEEETSTHYKDNRASLFYEAGSSTISGGELSRRNI